MVFDELKYGKVSDLVKTMELESGYFNLFGVNYALLMCPSKDSYGSRNGFPAEYRLQDTGEWAIYLWEDLGEKIQRPLLFHEIVEIYHKAVEEMGVRQAHNATLPWEKIFCERNLTPSELEKFLEFRKESGCNGFDLIE